MTKYVRLTALVLTAVMLCALLASCSLVLLNGTYSNLNELSTGTVYEFKLGKVTVTSYIVGVKSDPYTVSFKVNEDKITFSSDEPFPLATLNDDGNYTRTMSFEQGDDYVKIGGLTYEKR